MNSPKPNFIHKTPAITVDDFMPGHLKPQSYSAEDLSKTIIDLVGIDWEYTERQERDFANFKNRGSWNLYKPENIHDLWVFFDIFNDMFFNGVLTSYCTLGFHEPGDDKPSAFCQTDYPQFAHDPRY